MDCELIQYPVVDEQSGKVEVPTAFMMTEFHAILVFNNSIKGICLLNQQVMFHSEFDPGDGNIKVESKINLNTYSGRRKVFWPYFQI